MVYCISDIHGNYNAFMSLLRRSKIDLTQDTLYVLGDMIDWGMQSLRVLKKVKKLQETYPDKVKVLLGNHEQMMLLSTKTAYAEAVWFQNRGDFTAEQIRKAGKWDEMYTWLSTLPLQECFGDYILCHAVPKRDKIHKCEQSKGMACLIRNSSITYEELACVWGRVGRDVVCIPAGKILVAGHTTTTHFHESDDIFVTDNYINIDCGAKQITYGEGKLALLRLDDMRVWYSTARD